MRYLIKILYVLSATVRCILGGLELCMFMRAVLSWIPLNENNVFENFLYAVTEPFIYPVRCLFDKFGWFEGFPLDMSFFATACILAILMSVL